jgi:iron complex transport system substrate-binding protein
VQNDRVFIAPVGGFWWDRPSPEAILGIVWLAKVLYPDAMREMDLYAHTQKFYHEFYGYDLTHKEYETFFATTKEYR